MTEAYNIEDMQQAQMDAMNIYGYDQPIVQSPYDQRQYNYAPQASQNYSDEEIMQALNNNYQPSPQNNVEPLYSDEEIMQALQQPQPLQGSISHTEFAQQHPFLEGLADVAEGSLPIIGGVAGAIAGLPGALATGGFSSAGGAGIGAGAGEIWKRNIETLRGERPATQEQALKNIGGAVEEGLWAATGEKVFSAGSQLASKLLGKSGNLVDDLLLRIADINPELASNITQKGSKALDYFEKIKEKPVRLIQELTESDIRKPLNETLLKFSTNLGKEIGRIKEDLFKTVGDSPVFRLNVKNISTEKVNPILQRLFTDDIYKADINKSVFKKRFIPIIKEINAGVSPKRADELIGYLDDYVINYKKDFGDLLPFDQEVQKVATTLRSDLKDQLHKLSPQLAEYDKLYGEYSDIINAFKEIKPIKELSKGEVGKAARQSEILQQLLTSPNYARGRELIKTMPGGSEALGTGQDLLSAGQLLNVDLQGRVPLSKWAAIAETATTLPRKYAINKILPSRLAQQEGRELPVGLLQRLLNQKGIGAGTTTLLDQLLRGQ